MNPAQRAVTLCAGYDRRAANTSGIDTPPTCLKRLHVTSTESRRLRPGDLGRSVAYPGVRPGSDRFFTRILWEASHGTR